MSDILNAFTDNEHSFQLRLFCECGQATGCIFSFNIDGMSKIRDDTGKLRKMTEQPPYILTMSIPKNFTSNNSRKKRSTDTKDTCTA